MKILFVAAEVAPFSSVGGLSQVMYFLPKALMKMGHDVRIWSAKYGVIDGSGGVVKAKKKWPMKLEMEGLRVPVGNKAQANRLTGSQAKKSDQPSNLVAFSREAGSGSAGQPDNLSLICNVKSSRAGRNDPLVYFLENREYFELRANVYEYADDHIRFALLSKGCLEWLLHQRSITGSTGTTGTTGKKSGEEANSARGTRGTFDTRDTSDAWWPDLIHCNDWHTGYLIEMARTDLRYKDAFRDIPILYTVHNFKHQGNGAYEFRYVNPEHRDTGEKPLPGLLSHDLISRNALLRGVIHADLVNTVSKAYAKEVLTQEYGEGIDDLLRKYKNKLTGILNGLDTREFNPSTDQRIKQRYSWKSLSRRVENKLALEREFSLPQDAGIPLFALSGRMASQKGIELVMKALPHLLRHYRFQFIVLGGGDEVYRQFFLDLSMKFPKKVGVHLRPNFRLPRKVFAGADVVLMPSKFEPGGIVAMEAMRYGAVPLVRRTGGLGEIVTDFDPSASSGQVPSTGSGNGFSFAAFNSWALYGAMVEALTTYKNQPLWKKLIQNAMRADFSWDHAAKEYEALYQNLRKEA